MGGLTGQEDESMGMEGGEGEAGEDLGNYGGSGTKRRRTEQSAIERRLEKLLMAVGENVDTSVEDSISMAVNLIKETDAETHKDKIISTLIECVGYQPKMTVYSTVVGLLNANNHLLGGEIVERLMNTLRNALRDGHLEKANCLVSFVCDLVNCHVVSTHSCMSFIEALLSPLQHATEPQVRRDWFARAVLCALVIVGRALMERKPTELDRVLDTVQTYVGSRRKHHVHMLRVWSGEPTLAQEDGLDVLWSQVTNMRMNKWQENHLNRYYEAFANVLAEALQHNLPGLMPPMHQPSCSYPLPAVVFRLFDKTDCPEDGAAMPDPDSIERYLIQRDLTQIIQLKHLERKECASSLVNYKSRTAIPLNYVLLEVVFGELFRLPMPEHIELFYGCLLIELCKLQPNSMPQVLAQAAELLYQRVDTMQPICFDRFVNWFSYHLSNFQFRWTWDDWMDSLAAGAESQRQLFLREVLQKVQRFTYHQRTTEIVPAGFAPLLPAKPEPHFRFVGPGSDAIPGSSVAVELAQAIKTRCTSDAVLEILKSCPSQDEEAGCNALAVEVFTLTLLNLGSKTFSHSFAALTKYHAALKALTENNEEAQQCVLRAVYELWSTHTQMICVLVDKLLKMQIVEPAVLVAWVFSAELKQEFIRMWVWEMLQSALFKLSNHINRLNAEIIAQKDDDEMNGDAEKHQELNEKLAAAENVQKNLLLTVFQNFTIVLTEHLLSCESEGRQFDTAWYRAVVGRLRHMFLCQHNEAAGQIDNLEAYLFTPDIDPHILEVFHQFCALTK